MKDAEQNDKEGNGGGGYSSSQTQSRQQEAHGGAGNIKAFSASNNNGVGEPLLNAHVGSFSSSTSAHQ